MINDMDLQLGLALSSIPDKGFDLNCSEVEEIPVKNEECNFKKRNFLEAFEEKSTRHAPQTLDLLVLGEQSNQGDNFDELEKTSAVNNRADGGVVGWPPINSWRKKICQQNRHACVVNCVTVENGGGGHTGAGGRGRNSMYVKVKMEGVGIARKVDLSLYHSYQTLIQNLGAMFGKCQQSVQSYQLTFQDKEGDWLVAEDVNWGNFIRSVQRLKLMRKKE